MNLLKDMLYLKHNQISAHVNEFINLTTTQIDNYLYLLGNSSIMLEKTFNETKK